MTGRLKINGKGTAADWASVSESEANSVEDVEGEVPVENKATPVATTSEAPAQAYGLGGTYQSIGGGRRVRV
jgi:hypothetical protein